MRLARQNQRADNATLQWMADKVEGNLLAAHQEIQKLGLLYPEGQLAAEDVERAVLNVARYDVFGLRDAMLAGDIARTIRMIDGLRAEGEALPLVLWAVGEEIRLLARIAEARALGQDANGLMRRLRIFGAHERLALQALSRVQPAVWPAAVQHAHEVDRLIKGLSVPGRLSDPWEEMTRLALRVAAAGADREGGTAACPFPAPDFARPLPATLTPSPAAPAPPYFMIDAAMSSSTIEHAMLTLGENARRASRAMMRANGAAKNRALHAMADALAASRDELKAANEKTWPRPGPMAWNRRCWTAWLCPTRRWD